MNKNNTRTVVFGGGCFWCTEAVFQTVPGVKQATSGYCGGTVKNPTYKQVSSGKTGHVEVVKVEYDPTKITYEELLKIFFETHDPTTPDRQGNDIGTQYKSVIFYTDENQKEKAQEYIKKLNQSGKFSHPIVTEVKPLDIFYQAEEEHQNFYRNNPDHAYCQIVITPKLKSKKIK